MVDEMYMDNTTTEIINDTLARYVGEEHGKPGAIGYSLSGSVNGERRSTGILWVRQLDGPEDGATPEFVMGKLRSLLLTEAA